MLILAILVSCGARQDAGVASAAAPSAGGSSTPSASAAAPVDAETAALRLHMGEHFRRASRARDAVVQGDLETARTELAWLAEHEADPNVPTEWGGWLSAMRAEAAKARLSSDPYGVARSVAGVANQCGGCHQSLGRTVTLPHPGPAPSGVSAELPSGDPGVATHMEGHQWAAERMWAGLVMPSREAWAESLQVLSQPALDTLSFEVGPDQAEAVAASAYAVHDLAAAGLADDNPDTRADVYARILTACAVCHGIQAEGGNGAATE